MNLSRTTCTLALIGTLVSISAAPVVADEIFPDENLRAAIKAVLKKQGKDEIKEADLKNVYQVTARKKGIKSLSGLEKCTNLVLLDVHGNEVADITPLAGLKNLQSLDLSANAVKDIKPLTELVKLQYVQLEDNQVEDIAACKGLKKLSALYLSRNKVKSVEALKELPKLSSLYLGENNVTDVKPLGGLKWLANLDLQKNGVEDVTPLAGLTELRFTFLQGNKIKDFAPLIEMASKDAKGDKRFAPYWRLYLDDNPVEDAKRDEQIKQLKSVGVRVNWKPKKAS